MKSYDPLLEEGNFDIAIIGMSGRFPGASSVDQFWYNLCLGMESISFFSDEQLKEAGVDPAILSEPSYVKASPVLDGPELFDASFFGYSPREASFVDPQHRLFLECAWEALEHAGYDPDRYAGPIGVYGGTTINTYLLFSGLLSYWDSDSLSVLIGSDKDFLTTRVSYKLNLRGPSITVQSACSTSLVAIHLACQSLLNGECDMALTGGATVRVPHRAGYLYREGQIYSPDGHCRAFDAKAQGTVFGSGVGIIVLKRLVDAIADRDCIYAIIKGSAINNDGSLKAGYTAPSVDGQFEVVVQAQANAGVGADTITYVEAHGTGTTLGDPIEVAALAKAFRIHTDRKAFCAIGSVKTNVGHLDAAAGVTGLIKTVLALKHKLIPPSLHFEKANPEIDFENSPFYVSTALSKWNSDPYPRRAGVSALGVGGTNAHVILEEAPRIEDSGDSRPWQLLLLSAKTDTALDTATANLVEHLEQHSDLKLADVAYTLQIGRKAFDHRRLAVCRDLDDAVTSLKTLEPRRVVTSHEEAINRDVVFMFSGQGSQYVDMGLELYRTEPTFREQIDRCSRVLHPHLGFDLRDSLYPDVENVEEAQQRLTQTAVTQPVLFTIEYALAQLWMSWGVRPAALVGHSIGEYVAACLAGVFSLEDALSLVASRGRLMQELPAGSMLAIPLSPKEVQPLLDGELDLAAVNAPSLCIASGEREAVEALENALTKTGVGCRLLHTSHAFHSRMMDPILESFAARVAQVRLKPPQIPCVSNVSGTWISSDEATNPGYWAKHLRQTVRFSDCVRELLTEPNRVLLEVGPGQTLATLSKQHPNKTKDHVVLSSTRHPKEQRSDVAFILNTLGQLWLAGIQVDWSGFYAEERRCRLPLPTYPFERKRCWINTGKPSYAAVMAPCSSEDSERVPISDRTQVEKVTGKTYDGVPRNGIEQAVASIWRELLGIEQVGIHDNFFELGGHSLLATQVISRVRHTFGVELSLAGFFETPTVAELALVIEKDKGGDDSPASDQAENDDLEAALRRLGIS